MRFLFAFAASLALAQTVRVEPASPRQGDTLKVLSSDAAVASARLADRSARFFAGSDGNRVAMIPVPVLIKPGLHAVRLLDASGEAIGKQNVVIRDAKFRRQNVSLTPQVLSLTAAPGEIETVQALRRTVTDVRHWDEPLQRPVPGCMTSPFGNLRMHNGKPTGSFHGGLDQRGATGTPISAVAAGVVKIARMFNIHGGTVGIDHGQGMTTIYLHMSGFAVKEGDTVQKGNVIGYVGSTGRSSAPHLHWAIGVNGHHVNPAQWVNIEPCASAAKPKAPAKARPKTRRQ